MEAAKKKLRIVNKSRENVTIDIRNAGGIIKMSWNIFKSLFDICKDDTKFCQTKEETNETYNKFRKLLINAVSAFGNIKDKENPDQKQLETLGKCFNDLMILLKCPKEDLNELVIDKYNEVKRKEQEPKESKKSQQPKQYKKQNNKQDNQKQNTTVIPSIPVSTFGDLEALKQLKEQMDDDDQRGS